MSDHAPREDTPPPPSVTGNAPGERGDQAERHEAGDQVDVDRRGSGRNGAEGRGVEGRVEPGRNDGERRGAGRPSLTEPQLVVEDLATWFRTSRGVLRAVDGVSFELDAGQTLGIVGESGSGKSMLARSIMNLLPANAVTPDGGSVRFEGRELRGLAPRAARGLWGNEIAMVFQDPTTSLNPVVRIGRQITESLRRHTGLSRADARDRACELLRQVGIAEPERRLSAYPHELSGGMRQRVAIAVAIACRPKLLLADEPTTALDVTIQRQILDLLADLQQQADMAMVLITHDLGVVAGRADRVGVMYAGRIVEMAPTAALFEQPRHPYTEALLGSIPRLANPVHTRLFTIPGRPQQVFGQRTGCAFAPRCRYAQPRCLEEDPTPLPTNDGSDGHVHACFYPVGTLDGRAALERNLAAGETAAGLQLDPRTAAA